MKIYAQWSEFNEASQNGEFEVRLDSDEIRLYLIGQALASGCTSGEAVLRADGVIHLMDEE